MQGHPNVTISEDVLHLQNQRPWHFNRRYERGNGEFAIADRTDAEMEPDDWVTSTKRDKEMAPSILRKGAGAGWHVYC